MGLERTQTARTQLALSPEQQALWRQIKPKVDGYHFGKFVSYLQLTASLYSFYLSYKKWNGVTLHIVPVAMSCWAVYATHTELHRTIRNLPPRVLNPPFRLFLNHQFVAAGIPLLDH